jgi:hypothetical protein
MPTKTRRATQKPPHRLLTRSGYETSSLLRRAVRCVRKVRLRA